MVDPLFKRVLGPAFNDFVKLWLFYMR